MTSSDCHKQNMPKPKVKMKQTATHKGEKKIFQTESQSKTNAAIFIKIAEI